MTPTTILTLFLCWSSCTHCQFL